MARRADRAGTESTARKPKQVSGERACQECGVRLSSYNPNPTCWQHTMGHPWQGPNNPPKY